MTETFDYIKIQMKSKLNHKLKALSVTLVADGNFSNTRRTPIKTKTKQ